MINDILSFFIQYTDTSENSTLWQYNFSVNELLTNKKIKASQVTNKYSEETTTGSICNVKLQSVKENTLSLITTNTSLLNNRLSQYHIPMEIDDIQIS